MPIRIHPHEIEIPDQTPFANDELNRQDTIQTLTTLIGNIDGPCVMAVNAGWGMGKTTFLGMWAEYLRCASFPVVFFNAWETDFAQEPFVALSSELTGSLERLLSGHTSPLKKLKTATSKVLMHMWHPSARIATSAIPFIGSQMAEELARDPSKYAERTAAEYASMKQAMEDFRSALDSAASFASQNHGNKPLVVFIDELDRCKPTYALRLLEIAKHFFAVNHVVFVLALDRAQLGHSIQAVYGQSFDADGYLKRFFDIDVRLPNPSRQSLVKSSLSSLGVTDSLQTSLMTNVDSETTLDLIVRLLSSSLFSLRDALQVAHRLGVIFNSLPSGTDGLHLYTMSTLLLLRACSPNEYMLLVNGQAKDEDIVEALLPTLDPGLMKFRDTEPGEMAISVLISACILSRHVGDDVGTLTGIDMLDEQRELAQSQIDDELSYDERHKYRHAEEIVWKVARWTQQPHGFPEDRRRISDQCGYEDAITRIELFGGIDEDNSD